MIATKTELLFGAVVFPLFFGVMTNISKVDYELLKSQFYVEKTYQAASSAIVQNFENKIDCSNLDPSKGLKTYNSKTLDWDNKFGYRLKILEGDTLSEIAEEISTGPGELQRIIRDNEIARPKQLQPNDSLLVYMNEYFARVYGECNPERELKAVSFALVEKK